MKKWNICNYLLLAMILVGDLFYLLDSYLWVKSITSALFVLVGLINFVYTIKTKQNVRFGAIMLCGLVFAMSGDILLEIHFITGALLFAIGHVFYLVAYTQLEKYRKLDWIMMLCIFVPSLLMITLIPVFTFDIVMELVCIFYAFVISNMVAKAVANYVKEKSILRLVIMIGSILFFISDFALLFATFSYGHILLNIICLGTYYPAEWLLAYSILLASKKES